MSAQTLLTEMGRAMFAPNPNERVARATRSNARTKALFLSALACIASCTSAPEKSTSIPNGDAGETDGANACACDDKPTSANARCVHTLDVEMREADGAPLRDFAVSCCGRDLCVYSRTGADGRAQVRVCHNMDTPTFKVLGGRELVSFASPLRPGEAVSVPPIKATRLPQAGVAFPAAGQAATLASSGVSLDVSATTKVTISELEHPEPEDKLFRAAAIAADGVPEGLVPSGLRFDLLFGFAPMSTTFDPPAPITFPNTLGWPAGAQVAVYVHGVEIDDVAAPYGGWREHGTAAVTSDGKSIRADAVPALTIVGLARQ